MSVLYGPYQEQYFCHWSNNTIKQMSKINDKPGIHDPKSTQKTNKVITVGLYQDGGLAHCLNTFTVHIIMNANKRSDITIDEIKIAYVKPII